MCDHLVKFYLAVYTKENALKKIYVYVSIKTRHDGYYQSLLDQILGLLRFYYCFLIQVI